MDKTIFVLIVLLGTIAGSGAVNLLLGFEPVSLRVEFAAAVSAAAVLLVLRKVGLLK